MLPPKLLDVEIDIHTTSSPEADPSTVLVLDAGLTDPNEAVTFKHFYATAAAVLVEFYVSSSP
jgi:hypothetical protein